MLPVVSLILDFTVHKSVTYNGHSDRQILRPKTFNADLPIKDLNRKQLGNTKGFNETTRKLNVNTVLRIMSSLYSAQ